MTALNYAPIREQGIDFVVVVVKDDVLMNLSYAENMRTRLGAFFHQPAVLVTEESSIYFGRNDLVKFLANYEPTSLPWHTTCI